MTFTTHRSKKAKSQARNFSGRLRKFMSNKTSHALTAITCLLFANTTRAAGIAGLMTNWTTSVNSIITFLSTACLLAGAGGIAYGCKLIYDKSQERADVKNGQIVAAFVGGSFLCVLWVIVTVLVESSGGSSSNIGGGRP